MSLVGPRPERPAFVSELSLTVPYYDVRHSVKPGVTAAEHAELREARKKIRLLEQENEVLRRAAAYLSQANLKLGQSPK